MILLLAALASAEETVTYDRLFGSAADAPAAAPTAAVESGIPAWAWPVSVLALGGAVLLRARVQKAKSTDAAIRVLARQPLGDRSQLVLLDVIDADGERRRLLVGTGNGAPSLVADLGAQAAEAPASDEPAEPAAPANIAEEILAERHGARGFEKEAKRRGFLA